MKKILLPRLGKGPQRLDKRTLLFRKYAIDTAPTPSHIRWEDAVDPDHWPMLANDRVGDCAVASMAHHVHAWTANEGPVEVILSDDDVLETYGAITGYDPKVPGSDQGTIMLDALNHWRRKGIAGRKIEAYTLTQGVKEAKQAIWLFGGLYVGLALPISAQAQIGEVWRVPEGGAVGAGRPGSWGGHAVAVLGYGKHRVFCATWGSIQAMTWAFFRTYADEAYAVLSPDDWAADGRAPSGFDLDALREDLRKI